MANPAPQPPSGDHHDDEALDILRRIEPALARIDDRLRRVELDVAEMKGRMTGIEKAMDARFAGIEGQLRQIPTLYQLAGLIFAIFGAAFVLIRFAGH